VTVVETSVEVTQTTPDRSSRPNIVRALFRRKVAWFAAGWILLLLVASVFARWLAPHNPLTQNVARSLEGPSSTYWLGTDSEGRDILSRLMYGGGQALLGCVEVVGVAVVLGVPFGLAAGYFGKWIDAFVARLVDVLLGIPAIIVLLAVIAAVGNNRTVAMVVLGVIISAALMRLVRASVLAVRGELYVDAAKVSGLSSFRIIVKHVLPNIIAPVIIFSTLTMGIALLFQSGLAFLGVGLPPPTPDWGAMVFEAFTNIYNDPWLMVPSGGVIVLTILAFNTLGDALNATLIGVPAQSVIGQFKKQKHVKDQTSSSLQSDGRQTADELPLLVVSHVSIAAKTESGPVTLVDDISFELRKGEVLGIVGESGSGKTMTARSLMNLLPAGCEVTSGSILLNGVDVAHSEEAAAKFRGRKIAMISQEPMIALDPSFTIGSQLVEPLRLHRKLSRSAAKREARALLALVGIDRPDVIYSSFPHQISGGMAQRVCIAIALTGEPELVIADEPTTALDVTVQAEILELLRSLQQKLGTAFVLVTHNLGVIADIADHTLVMYAGEIVEECATQTLFDAPAHPYTIGLMSSAPERAKSGQPLQTIPGVVPTPNQWPQSCHFADRCPLAVPACRAEPIALISVGPDRTARCIRTSETLGEEAQHELVGGE
jgi:peptide/nickel transport system permease protein